MPWFHIFGEIFIPSLAVRGLGKAGLSVQPVKPKRGPQEPVPDVAPLHHEVVRAGAFLVRDDLVLPVTPENRNVARDEGRVDLRRYTVPIKTGNHPARRVALMGRIGGYKKGDIQKSTLHIGDRRCGSPSSL